MKKPLHIVAPHGALEILPTPDESADGTESFANTLFTIRDRHAPKGTKPNEVTLTGLELISIAAWTNQRQIDELIVKPTDKPKRGKKSKEPRP